ncbi:MAG: PorT family protein [Cytophagales bacterium]|nr:PorT family protein [Cytophagales bacterium]
MQRIVFTLVVLLLFTEGTKGKEHNFGMKGGLNLAWTERPGSYSFPDARIGFHAGTYGTYMLNDAIGLQLEILYSQQGEKRSTLTSTITDKVNYINIPLLYKYHFPQGFRIYVGPQVSFLVNAKTKIEPNAGSSGVNINRSNTTEDYKKIDVGLVVGIEHMFKAGLTINARYNVGVMGIYRRMSGEPSHRVFQLSVGYNLAKLVKR